MNALKKMIAKSLPRRPRRRGSVLVFVLLMIIFCTSMLTLYMGEAISRIKYYGMYYNRDDLRVEAYSAFELTLAVLNEVREIDGALYSPAQGWRDPYTYAEIERPPEVDIRITIVDESAKFSLRNATSEILNTLFDEMEIDLTEAQELTDALLDWMDEDDLSNLNGAETEHYEGLDPPYKAANAPIQSWDELKLIRHFDEYFFDEETGLPNDYHRQFINAMSLENDGPVNVNSAQGIVLQVIERLTGYDTGVMTDYLAGDDREVGTEDDNLINDRSSPYFPGEAGRGTGLTSISAELLKISVEARRGDANFLISTLVRWKGGNANASRSQAQSTARSQIRATGAEEGIRSRQDSTATQEDAGEALGYPWELVRKTENFKF